MTSSHDYTHAAIIVIDVQNDFVAPGAPIECSGAREIITPLKTLLEEGRRRGIPIIFTQEVHRKEQVDFGLELEYGEPLHCLEGGRGAAFYKDLLPEEGDHIIQKRRYSAFFATDLDILLKGLGINTLILTGVATDVCVRATAQDAHQHNYRVAVVPECVAGTSRTRHEAALENIAYIFGEICPLKDLVNCLPDPNLPMGGLLRAGNLSTKQQLFNS